MTLPMYGNFPQLDALPSAFIITLDELAAVSLSGEEHIKYLQGQVTCDVTTVNEKKLLNGAHCNAKGKVLSAFRLFEKGDELLLLQPRSTIVNSLPELQKFGVFAKVDIIQSELKFIAMSGTDAAVMLKNVFDILPSANTPVIEEDGVTIIFIDGDLPRYVLAANTDKISTLTDQLNVPIFSNELWTLLEISAGIPYVQNTDQEFVPQMLNLQAINAISFTKGCYLGQETVARMQYLGKNKKRMFTLTGEYSSLSNSIVIEKQIGENWRKAGDVISQYITDNNNVYVQIIMSSDTDNDTNFRIKDQQSSKLTLIELPYSLNQD